MNFSERNKLIKYKSKEELSNKEKLIQSYLIIYGLLVTFNQYIQNKDIHLITLACFVVFFILTVLYYIIITTPEDQQVSLFLNIKQITVLNLCACILGLSFSSTVTLYLFFLASEDALMNFSFLGLLGYVLLAIAFFCMMCVIAASLYIRKD